MEDFLTLKFTPTCPKCGHNGISIPDDPTDDSRITCDGCGVDLGSHGEFQAKIREASIDAAREHLSKAFDDAFKGLKHIKLNP